MGERSIELLDRETVREITDPIALAIWTYLQTHTPSIPIEPKRVQTHFGITPQQWIKAAKELKTLGLLLVFRCPDSGTKQLIVGSILGEAENQHKIVQITSPARARFFSSLSLRVLQSLKESTENTRDLDGEEVIPSVPQSLETSQSSLSLSLFSDSEIQNLTGLEGGEGLRKEGMQGEKTIQGNPVLAQQQENGTTARGQYLILEALPQSWEVYCREKAPELDPQAAWWDFETFWKTASGQKARKRSWLLCWQRNVRELHANPELAKRKGLVLSEADQMRRALGTTYSGLQH